MSLLNCLKKKYKKTLFTTPSHGQKRGLVAKFSSIYKYDISETDTHNPEVALIEAEKRAAEIYGVKTVKFLTNGSTSGVIAAVLACVKASEKVLIWDNAHPCHKNAVELAGAVPVFYETEFVEQWGIYSGFKPEDAEKTLFESGVKALIVTSPTYEGITSDIQALKQICERHNCYLIVDEAHGALYPFSEKLPQSAVKIADFTVQSLHKTAGGLNPTALLHCNCDCNVDDALKKINTTSPSYPLLMSIEANINFLNSKRGKKYLNNLIENIQNLKKNCSSVSFFDADITKIVAKLDDKSGFEFSEILYSKGIEDERANEKSLLLLTGIGTDLKKLNRLEKVLKKIY